VADMALYGVLTLLGAVASVRQGEAWMARERVRAVSRGDLRQVPARGSHQPCAGTVFLLTWRYPPG
jgi:hypothetical protein